MTNQVEPITEENGRLSFEKPINVMTAINLIEVVQKEFSDQPSSVKISPYRIILIRDSM